MAVQTIGEGDLNFDTLPNIDHIFTPTSSATYSHASQSPPPTVPMAVQLQPDSAASAAAATPSLDVMDILDSGLLRNEFEAVGSTPAQQPASMVPTLTDTETLTAADVDLLDDLDLDF